ncbi:MAG: polyphenol oxidase family protein [Proteobacteria bacterium]|nr:polyphenol oxidase family protein [Pseudomonadota bacterium]
MPVSTAQLPVLAVAERLSATKRYLHGFTRGLDLARSPRQTDDETARAWSAALDELGVHKLAIATQVHGDVILQVSDPTTWATTAGDADALLTTVPGLAVAVRVADCVPVLLAAPGAVCAVHAGWRGIAARIVPKAVERLCAAAVCTPDQVHAVVGPHICGRHYEVGPEVVDALCAAGVPRRAAVVPGRGTREHVDGGAAVAWQLAEAGVLSVETVRACTWEEQDLHSWRRDGAAAGRLAAIIALRPR